MGLRDLFRKRKPEPGDDLDGCALNFSQETEKSVPLEADDGEQEDPDGA